MATKRPSLRQAFLVTVSLAAASTASGCGSTVKGDACPEVEPTIGDPCATTETCTYDTYCGGSPVDYQCVDGAWAMEPVGTCNPPPPVSCPPSVPAAGTACFDVPPEGCAYDVASACGPLTVLATCVASEFGATWTVEGDTCSPTTPDCAAYAGPGECLLDTACRWLVPGCASEPQVPATAGCYPAENCVQGEVDSCPAGQACAEVVTDPCWNSMCDACGASVYVCQ
jgi:hypothetical protein